jgi:CBS domain-containing protein
MNCADVMTSPAVMVTADTDVPSIACLLLDHAISAVPVIDDRGNLVGIVSESDLLGRPPLTSTRGSWLRFFDSETVCLENLSSARNFKAKDVMTRHVTSVSDQTPLDLLASLMHRNNLKRVPVVRDGKVVGIVSRTDVLRALIDQTK